MQSQSMLTQGQATAVDPDLAAILEASAPPAVSGKVFNEEYDGDDAAAAHDDDASNDDDGHADARRGQLQLGQPDADDANDADANGTTSLFAPRLGTAIR